MAARLPVNQIPLKQVSYDDYEKDQRMMLDAFNDNFRVLDWLLRLEDKGNVYLEYGEGPIAAAVTFTFVNKYSQRPVVNADIITENITEILTCKWDIVSVPILEGGLYTKVEVHVLGIIGPIYPNTKVCIAAYCTGKEGA